MDKEEPTSSSIWDDYSKNHFGLYFGYTNRAGIKIEDVDEQIYQHYFSNTGIETEMGFSTFFSALGHRNYFQV